MNSIKSYKSEKTNIKKKINQMNSLGSSSTYDNYTNINKINSARNSKNLIKKPLNLKKKRYFKFNSNELEYYDELKKKIKCQQLINTIIYNDQAKHINKLETYDEPKKYKLGDFFRQPINKSRNIINQILYDKNDVFNSFNSNDSEKKLIYKTLSPNQNKKIKNVINVLVKNKNQILKESDKIENEIKICKNEKFFNSNIKNKSSLHKRNYSDLIDKNKKETIDFFQLMKKNANNVKKLIEPKDYHYVDNVVNRVIHEDIILNKDFVENNTLFDIKTNLIKKQTEFKKIGFQNLNLKENLKIENFGEYKLKNEKKKLNKKLSELIDTWNNFKGLKSELLKHKILRTYKPLIPRSPFMKQNQIIKAYYEK
jgi:hypothetical protein